MTPNNELLHQSSAGLYYCHYPATWAREIDDNTATFFSPFSDVELNVSAYQHADPKHQGDAREHITRFLHQTGNEQRASLLDQRPESASAAYEDDDGVRWRCFVFCRWSVMVLVTVSSGEHTKQSDADWEIAEGIIRSIHIGDGGPSYHIQ